jgi:hypothetical protein
MVPSIAAIIPYTKIARIAAKISMTAILACRGNLGDNGMNIERRMEFIVENLAALTVSQQKTDRRQDKVDEGMAELRQALKELAAAQKRTDARFDRWLDSFKNRSDGHHKKKPN